MPLLTGASSSAFRTYLVFQLLRFTAITVARKGRELLPHVFTLTPEEAVYFLWHLLSPAAGAFPLGSRMLCVARTFLRSSRKISSDRTFCICKGKVFSREVRKSGRQEDNLVRKSASREARKKRSTQIICLRFTKKLSDLCGLSDYLQAFKSSSTSLVVTTPNLFPNELLI